MTIAAPELNKKPGIYYAVTDDGLELPVIDVTHPAFRIDISQADLDRLYEEHVGELQQRARIPGFIQKIFLRYMMRRSRLMQALSGAAGTFLGGMDTYIMKLGPDNMGRAYASDLDRQISASLPGLAIRLRLQNIAHLLAEGIAPALGANEQPLHFLNIGGGPAIDSLNALIVLQKQNPDLLARRAIFIHVLDLDKTGPGFGRRALRALQATQAPLGGLGVEFEHILYNWADTGPLSELLRSLESGAVVAASSEGALFEYGTDEQVTTNLRTLRQETPGAATTVGSVTRADPMGVVMNSGSRAALQMRGIDAFLSLATQAGWSLERRMDRPSGHDVCLQKAYESSFR